jgi:predicted DNA repair protein MutK
MAGTSLLALLDDIASVLDDVALMTKMAAKKTAGVLGDDLALNAEQVSGVRAERELPVVWKVAKGSFRNKLILVPAAIAISALIPWLITPLLMLGGAYLCFEGAEKLAHKFLPHDSGEAASSTEAIPDDLEAFEQQKIKGAIRTDFILSAEIIVIALGTVQGSSLGLQIAVVAGIALLMTVGVYGLVGLIVKLDDIGLHLLQKPDASVLRRALGRGLLVTAPRLMHLLALVGTIAMFMVGGGILVHGWPFAHHLIEGVAASLAPLAGGAVLAAVTPTLLSALVGVVAGLLLVLAMTLVGKLTPAK